MLQIAVFFLQLIRLKISAVKALLIGGAVRLIPWHRVHRLTSRTVPRRDFRVKPKFLTSVSGHRAVGTSGRSGGRVVVLGPLPEDLVVVKPCRLRTAVRETDGRRRQPISQTWQNFSGARESDENKEALKRVQHDEREPERLQIDKAGGETDDPRQPHDDRESEVEVEVCLRRARGHFGARLGRVKDDVSAEHEEEDVEAHDAGKRNSEVNEESLLVAEPAEIMFAES